jgi:hypothetical protein
MNTQFNFKKTAVLIVTLTLLFIGAEQLAADASYICGCGAPPPDGPTVGRREGGGAR